MKEEFNFEEIKNKALEHLKSSKSILGKDGAFAPYYPLSDIGNEKPDIIK